MYIQCINYIRAVLLVMIIVVDTKEQIPWRFDRLTNTDIMIRHLKTGDYSIDGHEDLLCIERKKSVAEIAANITQERFWRELERMSKIKHRFIIFEFSYDEVVNFPESADIKQEIKDRMRVKGPFILRELFRLQVEYDINVLFCGHRSNAEMAAMSIIKRVKERYAII